MCLAKGKFLTDAFYGNRNPGGKAVSYTHLAVEELRRRETRVVLMTPQGRTFNQSLAAELAASGGHLIILCGHSEGVDHRVVAVSYTHLDVYKRQACATARCWWCGEV